MNKDLPFVKINRVESGKVDKTSNKIIWYNERVSEVGDLYSTNEELKFAEEFLSKVKADWILKNKKPKAVIYISNIAKSSSLLKDKEKNQNTYIHHVNKEWGEKQWQKFINFVKQDFILIKTSHIKDENINGIYSIVCDFRSVKAIMDKSDYFIGNEGGLSHLWATTRKKGIVFLAIGYRHI